MRPNSLQHPRNPKAPKLVQIIIMHVHSDAIATLGNRDVMSYKNCNTGEQRCYVVQKISEQHAQGDRASLAIFFYQEPLTHVIWRPIERNGGVLWRLPIACPCLATALTTCTCMATELYCLVNTMHPPIIRHNSGLLAKMFCTRKPTKNSEYFRKASAATYTFTCVS